MTTPFFKTQGSLQCPTLLAPSNHGVQKVCRSGRLLGGDVRNTGQSLVKFSLSPRSVSGSQFAWNASCVYARIVTLKVSSKTNRLLRTICLFVHSTNLLSLSNKILFSHCFRGSIYPSATERNCIWGLHCYRFLLSYACFHINAY